MSKELQLIINDSGLETIKARELFETFKHYFDIAEEWEIKAKTIIVTNENQKAEMAMARVGRLFLRDKLIVLEKERKQKKEQSLREGKAIDGIASIIKMLLFPIKEHFEKQEHFIEIRDAEIAEQKRIEGERLLQAKEEAERIAREKAEAEEREWVRKENERLKAEAIERDRLAEIEQARQKQLWAKAESERKEYELQTKSYMAQADAERIVLQAKAQKEREAREKLEKALNEVECPFCHKKFTLN